MQTSLWGIDSHGIARLPHYLGRYEAGSLNPQPEMQFEVTGPCTGSLDGGHALGISVCERATQEAITLAKAEGLGFVGVSNSSHCGAIGIYGRMIAEAGLVGLVFTHSDSFVAPDRGFRKFLGTNPICISVPCTGSPPVCLDMATSAAPWNKIINARREGIPIDSNLAYDSNGHPTEDPEMVACLKPMAAYKGYGLAMMIEIICGPLNGAPWGPNINPMYGDLSKRRSLGSFVGAIAPNCFAGGETFQSAVKALVESARSQECVDHDQPVLVPGDDQYQSEKVRLEHGIPVETGLMDQITQWSEKLSVPIPPSQAASL